MKGLGAIGSPLTHDHMGRVLTSLRAPGENQLTPRGIHNSVDGTISTESLPVLPSGGTESYPLRLAAEGNLVAATYQTGGDQGTLVLTDRQTGKSTQLENVLYRVYPTITPDGKLIYARRNVDGKAQLLLRSQSGGEEILATSTGSEISFGSLSYGTNAKGQQVERLLVNTAYLFNSTGVVLVERPVGSKESFNDLVAKASPLFRTKEDTGQTAFARFGPDGQVYIAVEGTPASNITGGIYQVNPVDVNYTDWQKWRRKANIPQDEIITSSLEKFAVGDDSSLIYTSDKGGKSTIHVADGQGQVSQIQLPILQDYHVQAIDFVPQTRSVTVAVETRTGVSIFSVGLDGTVLWNLPTPMSPEVQQILGKVQTRTIEATSKDGTRIPVELIGTPEAFAKMDAKNPRKGRSKKGHGGVIVEMNLYGGANQNSGPGGFLSPGDPPIMDALVRGHVVAMPILRGSADLGTEWSQAGITDRDRTLADVEASVRALRRAGNIEAVVAVGGSFGAWTASSSAVRHARHRISLPFLPNEPLFDAMILTRGLFNMIGLDPNDPKMQATFADFNLQPNETRNGFVFIGAENASRRSKRRMVRALLANLAIYHPNAVREIPTLVIFDQNDTVLSSSPNSDAFIATMIEAENPILAYHHSIRGGGAHTAPALLRAQESAMRQAFIAACVSS